MATSAPPLVAVGDLAGMTRAQREAYFGGLDPEQQSQQRAAYRAYVKRQNQHYLDACFEQQAVCTPASGTATTWAYTQGPMVFYAPVADGMFIKELLITINLTVTLAAGTGATYAATPSAPWSLFDFLKVELNNEQIIVRPVVYKYINMMRGYAIAVPNNVAPGAPHDTGIDALIGPTTPTATGANSWIAQLRIPLNAGYRKSPAGMLPAMSDSTRAKITLVGAANFLGVDVLTNAIAATGGTGNAVSSITGTVKCEAIYTNGSTFFNDRKLRLFLDDEPTVQGIQELSLQPLVAGQRQRQKISSLLQHIYVVSFVIDGQQATKYCTASNLTRLALNKDQVGQNKFFEYGVGTDQAMGNYWETLRQRFGQDWDIGVIPWIYAPQDSVRDTEISDGIRVLNMQPGGFVNVSHEYQLTAVGSVAGSIPRVETFLISLNPQGLKQIQGA